LVAFEQDAEAEGIVSEPDPPKGCFVAMGCAGALAAIAVLIAFAFVALFYFGFVQRGGVYDDLRVKLAQSQLNQLIPYIEMYRSRHGAYPDNLEQVAELVPENTPVMIHDASAPPTGPSRPYHYERVGEEHFILRSVGADGVAFTDDDIVPDGYVGGQTGLVLERAVAPPAPAAAVSGSDED
jgi:hypothetical protein